MATQSTAEPVSQSIEIEPVEGPVTIRYLTDGTGPPLVLLHGMGLDAAIVSWRHALADLADDYRVIAVDLPGMGQSDSPAIDYTTAYYIEVVDRILDTLSLKNPVLGGVSMGGAVALGYTLEHPTRIDQLVLVSSYGLGHEAPWRQAAYLGARAPFIDQAGQSGLGVLGAHPAFGTGTQMIAPTVPTDLATDMQEAAQDQKLSPHTGQLAAQRVPL